MLRHPLLALVAVLLVTSGTGYASQPSTPDGVARLLTRLEAVLSSGQPDQYLALLSALADRALAAQFAASVVQRGASRAVVRERARAPLPGTLPGDGHDLMLEVLTETGSQAQLATWRLEVKRLGRRTGDDAADDRWAISGQQVVNTLPGLVRLALDPRQQYVGRNIVVVGDDLRLVWPEATLFVAEAGGGATAVVVLGRGQMHFAPASPAERGQVRLFSGSEAIDTPLDAVLLRFAPQDLSQRVAGTLERRPVDDREWKRAAAMFREEAARSYTLDLGDLSAETWSMVPSSGDLVAEMRTRRFGTLTYSKSGAEPEDISLFDRTKRRNIAVYSSPERLARHGRFYSEDDGSGYRVLSYDIDASFNPTRQWLDGRARMLVQVTAPSINMLTLRLADALRINAIVSREYGRLLAVRVRHQHSVVVTLPTLVPRDMTFTLDVSYTGTALPQPIEAEAMEQDRAEEQSEIRLEQSFLYSEHSYWYPQAPSSGYSTATLRISVPQAFGCVASGEPVAASAVASDARRYTFVASKPVRYFSCLITPLVRAAAKQLHLGAAVAPGAERGGRRPDLATLTVTTNPRLQRQGGSLADRAADILQYYASLMGDAPYPNTTVAVVEWKLPGGHSPAYMAVLNQPLLAAGPVSWRDDPASFDNYPEFFIAHELAHQWWGQAVGWKNYHEQWLSEGFAQYFAALYAERTRGRDAFDSIIRRFRQWSLDKSDQGPIYLGYRVGHIKGDSRVFRAVVYNKGAAVLHMLRRLVGDQAFFDGLRRFYETWRFRKAGSDDLRQALERSSGHSLSRFFEQWVYGASLPTLTFASRLEQSAGGPVAVVRFEQTGEVFDVPVTVSVDYEGRPPQDVVVAVTERVVEVRVPLAGPVRKVDVNRDGAAVAIIK